MGKINAARVVAGGLVAGLVINIGETVLNLGVIAEQSAAAMDALGLPPVSGAAAMVFVVFGFLLGVALIWLYAAIRPRFGPGPRTALVAAVTLWALAFLWPAVAQGTLDLAPAGLLIVSAVWQLVETVIAALVGAAVYQEPSGVTASGG